MDKHLICPITQQILYDPVMAEDGHTYEKQALEMWLQKNKKSPVTGQAMGTNYQSVLLVKQVVEKYLEEHPEDKDEQYEPDVTWKYEPVVVPEDRDNVVVRDGWNNIAIGMGAVAIGWHNNIAIGMGAVAIGWHNNIAIGWVPLQLDD